MAGDDSVTSEGSKSGGGVTIHVRCTNGSKFSIQISLDSTVGSFKSVVADKCDIPAEQQKLIYKGRILKDDQSLKSYGEVWKLGLDMKDTCDIVVVENMVRDLMVVRREEFVKTAELARKSVREDGSSYGNLERLVDIKKSNFQIDV